MKIFVPVALTALMALAACDAPNVAEAPDAASPYIGKRLEGSNGAVFLFNADGTVGGEIRGEDIVGTYTATAREICSTYTSPDFLTDQEYCSVPVVDGDQVVFNRRDGTQSQPYTVID